MLTTGAMIKIGKVYKNFMIDVKPTNIKLKDRAQRIVSEIAHCSQDEAKAVLEENEYKIKEAILQIKYSLTYDDAKLILSKYNGVLSRIFSAI